MGGREHRVLGSFEGSFEFFRTDKQPSVGFADNPHMTTPMHRVVALVPILVMICVSVWRMRSPRSRSVPPCIHPVGVRQADSFFAVCLPRQTVSQQWLRRRLEPGRCTGLVPGDKISAGQQIVMLDDGRFTLEPMPAELKLTLGLNLDLNRATEAGLEALPRIGPVLADRIVQDRLSNGPYFRVEDIQRVRGIGPAVVRRISPLVTVKGPLSDTRQP
jgi:hypothetical protein